MPSKTYPSIAKKKKIKEIFYTITITMNDYFNFFLRYRFLRRCDRNLSSYPSLHYPEVYLLHGGYQSFFSNHKSLCEPCSYQPMVDPKHEKDLRKFRVKSNSWSGDLKRQASRSGLKRLGLF